MSQEIYQHKKQFKLESGKRLHNLKIAFHTYGKLNPEKDNVIWVCHALTGNSDVFDWWKGLFGLTDHFNPHEHFIVCANVLGSPYGSTGPQSGNKLTGQSYLLDFPQITIRDMVEAHKLLATHLGIVKIDVLIGGSLGGQQALEWAVSEPNRIKNLVILACNAAQSPWAVAFNESQRLAIETDRTFFSRDKNGGQKGLKAARSIALLSYRTANCYNRSQFEDDQAKTRDFKAASYQNYQGEKLVKRFDAFSYHYLTKAMDSHNVGRNRGGVEKALASVSANVLAIGIQSDLLFPSAEQVFIAENVASGEFKEIESIYGHDGFLLETRKLSSIIRDFLERNKANIKQQNLRVA